MALPRPIPERRKPLFIHNRKYIGCKQHLLDFIAGVIAERAPEARSLADLFAGSAVVAHHFAARGFAVTASDTLYHNWAAAQCFLGGKPGEVEWAKVEALLAQLDRLAPVHGYCYREYGGSYFTLENAGRIDAVREAIAALVEAGAVNAQEETVLLTSLIYAADKAANTCGQYDAFLKHLGADPYDEGGRHRVDAMVYKPLELALPQAVETGLADVRCADAAQVAAEVEVDVLYLDPPYNARQYIDNYHVLENIARWEKPELYGKTRKFERDHLKSPYSSRRFAAAELERLVARAHCRHILLSYNNEGIIPDEQIVDALSQRGPVEVFERTYNVFGNGAGRSRRRQVVERLFYCRVVG